MSSEPTVPIVQRQCTRCSILTKSHVFNSISDWILGCICGLGASIRISVHGHSVVADASKIREVLNMGRETLEQRCPQIEDRSIVFLVSDECGLHTTSCSIRKLLSTRWCDALCGLELEAEPGWPVQTGASLSFSSAKPIAPAVFGV